jgi:hypothetical protein
MFLVLEQQEDDIELANLESTEHARPLQELHAAPNNPSDADLFTTHGDYRYPSSQNELLVSHSAHYRDPTSRFYRDINTLEPEDLLVPSHVEHRASDRSTTYRLSTNPSTPMPRRTERTTQSLGIASRQPNHSLDDQPQFLSGEIIPHTGKGKGRIPNATQERSVQVGGHPYNLVQHSRLPSPQFASHYFGKNGLFEFRQYLWKKYQHPQNEARYVCTAAAGK